MPSSSGRRREEPGTDRHDPALQSCLAPLMVGLPEVGTILDNWNASA
jgi:hypothetical protein